MSHGNDIRIENGSGEIIEIWMEIKIETTGEHCSW
jgi:hypothetical protein